MVKPSDDIYVKTSNFCESTVSTRMTLDRNWLQENGIGALLLPSEFMDVNYGEALRRYLCQDVELLRIHRFDPNDVRSELASREWHWSIASPIRVHGR